MPIALDPKRTAPYTLKSERDSEEPTVFSIRGLSLRERAEVEDMAFTLQGEEVRMKNAQRRLALLERGLVGWSGFRDGDGAAVVFQTGPGGRPTEEALDRLDDATVVELAEAISDLSGVTESDQD